jgi:hypothetical protein
MTDLRARHGHTDSYLKRQVAAYTFAIANGRPAAAADALWRMASHLEIIEPGQQVLTANNLDNLKQRLADLGYQLVEVTRHG